MTNATVAELEAVAAKAKAEAEAAEAVASAALALAETPLEQSEDELAERKRTYLAAVEAQRVAGLLADNP